MGFQIQEIRDKKAWEEFLNGCQEKTFLQSWNWGEFNRSLGQKIWRWGVYENDRLVAVSFFYKVEAKRGAFLFLPHGPVLDSKIAEQKTDILKLILEHLISLAKKEKAGFLRIAPIWLRNLKNEKVFKDLGFRQAPFHIHAELTWNLDIGLAPEDLLAGMRKTTRYLIRQAEKSKNLKAVLSQKIEDLTNFNRLYQETVGRQNFVPFSFDYLKKEFLAFLADDQIVVFLVYDKDVLLASAMIVFWQGIAFYHHGASRPSPTPASYWLQWQAIKEAKKRNCQLYNFWGISQTRLENKNHPWWGLTLFKMGFGGYCQEYVRTQDFVLSPRYWLAFFIEKIRKTKRGF